MSITEKPRPIYPCANCPIGNSIIQQEKITEYLNCKCEKLLEWRENSKEYRNKKANETCL